MAVELYGTNGLTNEARTWYERGLLMRAVPNFVHAQPMFHKQASVPQRGGRVVNWRRLELISVATTALSESSTPADTQITYSSVNATIDQYGVIVKVSDVADTQSIDPVVMDTVEMLGENLGDTLDILARNVMTAGTTVQFASTAGSRAQVGSNMNLTYAEVREAVSTLENQNARKFNFPDGPAYASIIREYTKRDLFGDSDILTSMQNAANRGSDNPFFTGSMPNVYSVKFFQTTNARVFASASLSGADVEGTIIFGQEAYGIASYAAHPARIMVVPRSTVDRSDPLQQYGIVGWKASFQCVRLNENFAVRVEHATSNKTAA